MEIWRYRREEEGGGREEAKIERGPAPVRVNLCNEIGNQPDRRNAIELKLIERPITMKPIPTI